MTPSHADAKLPAIALVGCGAISEATYLPALIGRPAWKDHVWLVEPNPKQAAQLVARYGFAAQRIVSQIEALPGNIVLAINATPSHLHHAITLDLLERDCNVLVEKPFAETAMQARAMCAQAATRGRLISVNQSRRAGPSNRSVYDILRRGDLGVIQRITWSEGHPFDWPTQSGFNFRRPWTGHPRGVVLDIGVHVFDLLCWWLGGTPHLVDANTDSYGGPEASATATLRLGPTQIDVRLSYLVKLKNEIVIEGTQGAIRLSTADYDGFERRDRQGRWRTLRVAGSIAPVEATVALIDNFLRAARGEASLMIDPKSAIPALVVVDDIYAHASQNIPEHYLDHLRLRPNPVRATLRISS